MKTGLLWQDHNPRLSLEQHIARAVAAYRRKFDVMPEVCAVNEHALGDVKRVGTVRVVGKHNVLRGTYWVGMEEKRRVEKCNK